MGKSANPERNIVIAGFMGTGKSSVGRILGKRLGRKVLDTDKMIERSERKRIKQIFKERGEAYFRRLESQVVRRVSGKKTVVIVCGGGTIIHSGNLKQLKRSGTIFCLTASPERIAARLKRSKSRPLLAVAQPLAEIKRLLRLRKPFYKKSDYAIDTDRRTPQQVASRVIHIFQRELKA